MLTVLYGVAVEANKRRFYRHTDETPSPPTTLEAIRASCA
jgi:hypothetical protein